VLLKEITQGRFGYGVVRTASYGNMTYAKFTVQECCSGSERAAGKAVGVVGVGIDNAAIEEASSGNESSAGTRENRLAHNRYGRWGIPMWTARRTAPGEPRDGEIECPRNEWTGLDVPRKACEIEKTTCDGQQDTTKNVSP